MKTVRILSIFVTLVIALSIFTLPGVALAQNGQPTATPTADTLNLTTQYPTINGLASDTFKYSVDLNYKGVPRVFDLKVTSLPNWTVTITPLYDTSTEISSISMEEGTTQDIQVSASYTNYPLPDPGEYKMTLTASSGNVTADIDLIAKVTAKYALTANPANNLYSTNVKSGHDNFYTIKVQNTGTAPIEDIACTSDEISGWVVTFNPTNIGSLDSQESRNIQIDIMPAAKTVSGDYMLDVYVNGKQASADKMEVRVTVQTSTIWGWVGVIIIVIVIAGLVLIFMRFGRR